MSTITKQTTRTKCAAGLRRAKVGAAVAVGTLAAGVPAATSFAEEPTPDEAAGEALGDLAERGADWVSTYAMPAAVIAVGAGLVLGLLIRFGKRIGRAVG